MPKWRPSMVLVNKYSWALSQKGSQADTLAGEILLAFPVLISQRKTAGGGPSHDFICPSSFKSASTRNDLPSSERTMRSLLFISAFGKASEIFHWASAFPVKST